MLLQRRALSLAVQVPTLQALTLQAFMVRRFGHTRLRSEGNAEKGGNSFSEQ